MLIGDYTATYTGRSMCGFVSGHEYIINIDKDRLYQVNMMLQIMILLLVV